MSCGNDTFSTCVIKVVTRVSTNISLSIKLKHNRVSSMTIETIRDYQGLPETIRDYQRLLETTRDYQRLLETMRDYQRVSETIRDY